MKIYLSNLKNKPVKYVLAYSGVSIPYICMDELEQQRLSLAGQVLQGLLERDTGWTSKILDDVFYERLAKHTVKIVDAVLKELKKEVK